MPCQTKLAFDFSILIGELRSKIDQGLLQPNITAMTRHLRVNERQRESG